LSPIAEEEKKHEADQSGKSDEEHKERPEPYLSVSINLSNMSYANGSVKYSEVSNSDQSDRSDGNFSQRSKHIDFNLNSQFSNLDVRVRPGMAERLHIASAESEQE
jgi:hypothetical protein